MAFRKLGTILADLMSEPEKLQAAASEAPRDLDGEAPLGGDASPLRSALDIKDCGSPAHAGGTLAELPTLFADAPAPSGSGMEKDRSGEAPASLTGPRQKESETERPYNRRRIAPELRLIAINDARGHTHAAKRVPARSPRVSLSVIEGGLHAAFRSNTGTSMRSRNS